jgi:hypothetical protein
MIRHADGRKEQGGMLMSPCRKITASPTIQKSLVVTTETKAIVTIRYTGNTVVTQLF